ncbi:hypothetical protein HJC23_007251 [Cyclotella cryptica]|uniref:Procollagen-proline 4-dioxygenase n=1 Tax=Cyclotella cryptica TaxID=29204 RepID=A0ABD3Q0H0_9STRA|eukprot:CCRYP_010032-RA/>CCRYP_010032-RA protein AED:0.07 eAED:-0.08 QI:0/-1/0/1/-1/1/1/0/1259
MRTPRSTIDTILLLILPALAAARSVPSIYSENPSDGRPPSGPLPDPPQECHTGDESCLIGDDASSSDAAVASLTRRLHCVNDTEYNSAYQHLGNLFCFHDADEASSADSRSDYVQPSLNPLQIAPILNAKSEIATQYVFQMGLPRHLIHTILTYCNEMGITDLLRNFTSHSPIPALPGDKHNGRFLDMGGKQWYAQRPASKWKSDMHWISPANELSHEDYLAMLFRGGFEQVLAAIGDALHLDGLVAYHLTFIGVSYSDEGYIHHDTQFTNGGVYNLIIPLLLEEDVPPELTLLSDEEEWGGFKYRVGGGVLMGDSAMHGTRECNYRNISKAQHGGMVNGKKIGMRLAATVYIADINADNVANVAAETLTQTFPLANEDWLMSQAGRHWRRGERVMIDGGKGRKAFRFRDELDDCYSRKERGMCERDEEETRKKCLKTCGVYIEQGPISATKQDDKHVQVCVQNRTGGEDCKSYEDMQTTRGDFIAPHLAPGELFPILWRDTATFTTQYAFQIGFPPELHTALQKYCDDLGMTDLFRELLGPNPIPPEDEHTGRFVELADGNKWYAQRPAKKWTSNMHWVSPADEKTHEEYLKVLAEGNFDLVLDAIGRYLGLEGLVAYHLTFIGVSHSEKGYIHYDSTNTGASVYNVIIPLILEEDALPELVMIDDNDESKSGSLKYRIGMGALMGDDAMHGTEACDYRSQKGMRMAATVYIADINSGNARDIATQTLTQIYPLPDVKYLLSQAGRHWGDNNNNSLRSDKGRKPFLFHDKLMDCADRADKGMCVSQNSTEAKYTREKCLQSCHIYDEQLNAKSYSSQTTIGNEAKSKIDSFFENIEYDVSCDDDSSDCQELAKTGLCMTDPRSMKEKGCAWSCLYCLTPDSRDIYIPVEEQIFTEEGRDPEELPTPDEIAAVIAETEEYLVNEVLLFDEYEHVRLSCRNYLRECSLWAAEGECEVESNSYGWMRKNCPAACKDCLKIDPTIRCPVDYDSNIFRPGDIGRMFERWLEEAGQDVSTFSPSNPPRGGSHPFGQLTVITSPYHDMMPFLSDEDMPFVHEYTPLPWVVAIDNFLSEEECQRLIELGGDKYERSTEYSSEMNIDGSFNFVESEGRTSTNTWCQDECRNDPIAKGVIERITNMTGIPYDNYEDFQLVRYLPGQFYQKHHDFTDGHERTLYGPRLLTFFLYLNDVEEGGGTEFADLNFVATPKKGMALVWPSVTNENMEVKDDWTWHEALPVMSGIKFGANAWIHLRDYQHVPDYC